MILKRSARLVYALAAITLTACHVEPWPPAHLTNQQLFTATMAEYRKHHWDNAVTGFDKLTLELPSRDPLMPPALYFLGKSHEARDEHLLAAQSFSRLTEGFPDDSLGDDALLAAGQAYSKLWHKPTLDAQYGETALNTFRTLLQLYPNSSLRAAADVEIFRLNSWMAAKTYDNGMHYFRRHAYDSAIIYFKDVVKLFPGTPQVKSAQLRLAESYRSIRYHQDERDVCTVLWQAYPRDRDVRQACGAGPQTAATATPSSAAVP